MPWTAESFRKKHNRKLRGAAAGKAAAMASAMIREGVPEGTAIATGSKRGDKMMASDRTKRQSALYDKRSK